MNSFSATRRQLARLHAVLGELGVTDREHKLRAVGAVLYRDVNSTTTLTTGEASIVIDTLQSLAGKGHPQAALAEFIADVERRRAS